jgi:hypothetical protein
VRGRNQIRCAIIFPAALAALMSVLCCLGTSSLCFAQEIGNLDDFTWRKDISAGREIAASRSDSSFNFFDVGDLSFYSQYLVEQDLLRLSAAAGLTIEHTPTKHSTVAIIHASTVFGQLKTDKPLFNRLGIPDSILITLEKQVTSDTPKCLNMTITNEEENVTGTFILLSEKFDDCLLSGLLNAFGISAADINVKTLIDVCVLYEGRRRGLRDRQSLTQEMPKLRDLCIARLGDAK